MAFQSVPDTVGVEVRATLFGVPVENTLYFDVIGGYDQSDVDLIAEMVNDAWVTYMLPELGVNYELQEVYAKGLENILDLESTDASSASEPGALAAPTLPGNVTFAIKFQTGFTGRSARGRNYVAGLADADVSANVLSSTRANAIRDAYISIGTALNAAGYRQVVVSRWSGGVKRTTGLTLPVTVISYTDLTVDTMKRRLV